MRVSSKNVQNILGARKCANSVRRGNATTRQMVSLLLARPFKFFFLFPSRHLPRRLGFSLTTGRLGRKCDCSHLLENISAGKNRHELLVFDLIFIYKSMTTYSNSMQEHAHAQRHVSTPSKTKLHLRRWSEILNLG